MRLPRLLFASEHPVDSALPLFLLLPLFVAIRGAMGEDKRNGCCQDNGDALNDWGKRLHFAELRHNGQILNQGEWFDGYLSSLFRFAADFLLARLDARFSWSIIR